MKSIASENYVHWIASSPMDILSSTYYNTVIVCLSTVSVAVCQLMSTQMLYCNVGTLYCWWYMMGSPKLSNISHIHYFPHPIVPDSESLQNFVH